MKSTYIVKIEKLVFGGQGLAHFGDVENKNFNNKTVFVWNALPGEEVEISIIKNKKTYIEAVAVSVLKPSQERIEPKDDFFLSTSAWQILTPERENYWKRVIATETYRKIGNMITDVDSLAIGYNGLDFGYRNKMEFSFTSQYLKKLNISSFNKSKKVHLSADTGRISLAFFERGEKTKFAIEYASLASPVMNAVAQNVLSWINSELIPLRSLKSLILRSNTSGEIIVALFLKDRITFKDYPKLDKNFVGFKLYYSTHKSPASIPTELLYSSGREYLIQDILGVKLKFGIFSFFQINTPVFEMAMKDILKFIDSKKTLIDFYAGVGAISLPFASNRDKTILVESNEEAVSYARENIAFNNISNVDVRCISAEKITDVITSDIQIILDPPRSGLHESVTNRLLTVKPERIVYLSCNLSTQARDIRRISEAYELVFLKLYNFFPRTPHMEGLVVLERK